MDSTQSILLRFYLRQVLISGGCSIIAWLIFGILELILPDPHNWLLHDSIISIVIYISLVIAFVFSALSLSMFLNVFDFIRNRILLSGIAWIGLPALLLVYVIYQIPELIGIIATIPYILGLIITFWRFRKRLTKLKRASLEIITKENRKTNEGSSVEHSIWG